MKIKNKKFHFLLLICLIPGYLFTSCLPATTSKSIFTSITVQLQWTHQATFSGMYAADQMGYYRDEGLQVKFLEGGPSIDHLSTVANGGAEFGTTSADSFILARSQGKSLRAVAVIDQLSPIVFVTLANSGITRPQQFAGKTIRSTSSLQSTLHAMTSFVGVAPSQYKEISLPSDVSLFATGEVPIWGMFINGMVIDIKQAGHAINIIHPDDYRIHFYGDVIFTTDQMIEEKPELVLKFLKATLKGWTYAITNPQAMGEMVKRYNPDADLAIENKKMLATLNLVNTGEDPIGWMREEIWEEMENTLTLLGILTKPLDMSTVYDKEFLEEIYQTSKK